MGWWVLRAQRNVSRAAVDSLVGELRSYREACASLESGEKKEVPEKGGVPHAPVSSQQKFRTPRKRKTRKQVALTEQESRRQSVSVLRISEFADNISCLFLVHPASCQCVRCPLSDLRNFGFLFLWMAFCCLPVILPACHVAPLGHFTFSLWIGGCRD